MQPPSADTTAKAEFIEPPVVEVETPPPIAEIIVPLSERGELNFFYPCREALREAETKLIAAAEEINRTGSGADLVITITKL